MERTERIARKILAENNDFFGSKEWVTFTKKVTIANRTFGRQKEFEVKFWVDMEKKITAAIHGPIGVSSYISDTSEYTQTLEENQKIAKEFLNEQVNRVASLKSAIDYADKKAKELQKELDKLT